MAWGLRIQKSLFFSFFVICVGSEQIVCPGDTPIVDRPIGLFDKIVRYFPGRTDAFANFWDAKYYVERAEKTVDAFLKASCDQSPSSMLISTLKALINLLSVYSRACNEVSSRYDSSLQHRKCIDEWGVKSNKLLDLIESEKFSPLFARIIAENKDTAQLLKGAFVTRVRVESLRGAVDACYGKSNALGIAATLGQAAREGTSIPNSFGRNLVRLAVDGWDAAKGVAQGMRDELFRKTEDFPTDRTKVLGYIKDLHNEYYAKVQASPAPAQVLVEGLIKSPPSFIDNGRSSENMPPQRKMPAYSINRIPLNRIPKDKLEGRSIHGEGNNRDMRKAEPEGDSIVEMSKHLIRQIAKRVHEKARNLDLPGTVAAYGIGVTTMALLIRNRATLKRMTVQSVTGLCKGLILGGELFIEGVDGLVHLTLRMLAQSVQWAAFGIRSATFITCDSIALSYAHLKPAGATLCAHTTSKVASCTEKAGEKASVAMKAVRKKIMSAYDYCVSSHRGEK